jgi:hypothetical protein
MKVRSEQAAIVVTSGVCMSAASRICRLYTFMTGAVSVPMHSCDLPCTPAGISR